MYYVIYQGNQIMEKHYISIDIDLPDNAKQVTKEIYDQIKRLPADFEMDEYGNIISITPAPEPEPESQPALPPTLQELHEQQLAQAEAIAGLFEILMLQQGGGM